MWWIYHHIMATGSDTEFIKSHLSQSACSFNFLLCYLGNLVVQQVLEVQAAQEVLEQDCKSLRGNNSVLG